MTWTLEAASWHCSTRSRARKTGSTPDPEAVQLSCRVTVHPAVCVLVCPDYTYLCVYETSLPQNHPGTNRPIAERYQRLWASFQSLPWIFKPQYLHCKWDTPSASVLVCNLLKQKLVGLHPTHHKQPKNSLELDHWTACRTATLREQHGLSWVGDEFSAS